MEMESLSGISFTYCKQLTVEEKVMLVLKPYVRQMVAQVEGDTYSFTLTVLSSYECANITSAKNVRCHCAELGNHKVPLFLSSFSTVASFLL